MRTEFWLESLKGRYHSVDLLLRLEHNIKMDFREIVFGVWVGFIWLKIGTGGGLL
jgi:hypothetical protein